MKNQQLTTFEPSLNITLSLLQEDHSPQRTEAEIPQTDGRNSWIIASSSPVIPCHTLIADPFYEATMNNWAIDQTENFIRNFATNWSQSKAGTMLIFCPPQYLWKARKWLDENLEGYSFQQLLISHYPNSKKPKHPLQFRPSWEGILLYRHKSSQRKVFLTHENLRLNDCFITSAPEQEFNGVDKKEHPRQRPLNLMKRLIQAITSPGDLVCDPFCGIGTTGIAAVQSGRRFYGIEKNNHFRYLTKKRLADHGKEEIKEEDNSTIQNPNTLIQSHDKVVSSYTNVLYSINKINSLFSNISTLQKKQLNPFCRIGKVIMKPTELVLYN